MKEVDIVMIVLHGVVIILLIGNIAFVGYCMHQNKVQKTVKSYVYSSLILRQTSIFGGKVILNVTKSLFRQDRRGPVSLRWIKCRRRHTVAKEDEKTISTTKSMSFQKKMLRRGQGNQFLPTTLNRDCT